MDSIAEFTAIQQAIKDKIIVLNAKVTKIKKSLGKEIAKTIVDASLTFLQIPLRIPRDLAYLGLGGLGFGLMVIEGIRLKPYLKEIIELEKQYNDSGKVYLSKLAEQSGIDAKYKLDLEKQGYSVDGNGNIFITPKPEVKKSNRLLYSGLAFAGFILYKKFKKKRKK